MVYEGNFLGDTTIRSQKLSKKAQDKEDKVVNNYMKLIGDRMIGDSNYIGISLIIQEVKSIVKTKFT